MIRLITNRNRSQHPRIVDAMFRARALTFRDRLGWDVSVEDGWEVDRFDDCNPIYLVSVDETGQSQASIRLMPTTGPTLLSEVFADQFDEPVDIKSATVWEATRFCLHGDATGRAQTASAEILMGICEVGLAAGLSTIIGVYDPRLVRVYRRIGWSPEPLAECHSFPHGPIYVGLWDVSEAALAVMRERSGLTGSILDRDVSAVEVEAA